jgi:4-hydroxybenzoate polyprenyltransferase
VRNTFNSLRLVQPFAAYSLTQQSLFFSDFSWHWFQPVAMLMFTGGFIAYNYFSAGLIMRLLAAIAFVFFLMAIHPGIIFLTLLIALMILSVLYLHGTVNLGFCRLTIRKIPFLKTVLLAVIWTFATAFIPLAERHSAADLTIESTARFLFLFPVMIASDLIDLEKDTSAGVLSLPVIAGEKKSRWIMVIFLLLYLVFMKLAYLNSAVHQYGLSVELMLLITVAFTGSLCLIKLKNKATHRILLDISVSSLFLTMMIAEVFVPQA